MKKIILILILTIPLIQGHCVELAVIKKVALNFMNKKQPNIENTILEVVQEKLDGETAFYVVNFSKGGWVIVSNSKSTVPILGYDYKGKYEIEGDKPEAFKYLINNYKNQIIHAIRIKSGNLESYKMWETMLNDSSTIYLKSYIPNTSLLAMPKGIVRWNQSLNNSDGCTPSYNQFCITSSDCNCGRKPTGCGAVAMGQIMWYWEWPKKSNFRIYDWKLMPDRLTNYSSTAEGQEIAQLLNDCGDAANKHYISCNTWTTVENIENAFKNQFLYKGVDLRVRASWPGNVWLNLLRAEINAERPVLYRGDKSDLSGEKHIFVLTGYDSQYPDYFCFNFGWGDNYYSSYQYLNDLTPGNSEFNENQMAIIGISPSCNEVPININNVSYSSVYDSKNEYAKNNVSLPATGGSLNIENGGKLTLCAGNLITLNSGFNAKIGSSLKAFIAAPNCSNACGISVAGWTNYFTDGVLRYNVTNANTFEFEVFTTGGSLVFQNAGSVSGNPVVVWDGTNSVYGWYTCRITFRNNCGEKVSNSYNVLSPGK